MAEPSPLESDAQEYIKLHKLPQLFEILTSKLVFYRPSDPRAFMKDHIAQLQKARANAGKESPPGLIDESNIRCVFAMLDITKRGYITTIQYHEAMKSMGLTDYNKDPNGAALNKISQDTFVRESKAALQRACSTYSTD